MRELSLFSGAGGGVLGSKILGWETVGYIEWEDYCQKVIAQRIKDGIFDNAPIFGDVRTFVSEGYAEQYKGMVDVVSGGFPCQPFSVAGKRKAGDDSRDMWPATLDVINAVQPPIVFLENVPGLLSATVDDESGRPVYYFGGILRDLAESGYDAKWCVLGADDVGAPHHRKRLWILGYSNKERGISRPSKIQEANGEIQQRNNNTKPINSSSASRDVADTNCAQRERGRVSIGVREENPNISSLRHPGSAIEILANTSSIGRSGSRKSIKSECPAEKEDWEASYVESASLGNVWAIEPNMGRVANGVPDRANRLKAIGNGQVPITMATAYSILSNEFNN